MQTGLWQDTAVTEGRLRRIHAVTRHYATLRGGVTRVILAFTAIGGTHGLYLVERRGPMAVAMALLSVFGAAALGVVATIRVKRWMDRRFGRVRSGGELLKGALPTIAIWGYMAANYLDKRYALTTDAPSIVFLGSAAFGAWLMFSVGRYGLHNLLPTVVSLIAAMGLVGVDDKASFENWQWNAMRVTALAWLAAGLIDLGLLWKTLGRTGPSVEGAADVA